MALWVMGIGGCATCSLRTAVNAWIASVEGVEFVVNLTVQHIHVNDENDLNYVCQR